MIFLVANDVLARHIFNEEERRSEYWFEKYEAFFMVTAPRPQRRVIKYRALRARLASSFVRAERVRIFGEENYIRSGLYKGDRLGR